MLSPLRWPGVAVAVGDEVVEGCSDRFYGAIRSAKLEHGVLSMVFNDRGTKNTYRSVEGDLGC